MLDEDLETGDAADPELEDEIEGAEEFEDELEDEDPEEIVDEPEADDAEDSEDEAAVPARRARAGGEDDEDDEDDLNPDDVEADLDTILKDRIAAGDDDEDDEEVEEPGTESGERVAAKTADEFTCPTCFLIVHPRQFGRSGALTCPEGYDPCGGIDIVLRGPAKASKAKKG